MSDIYYCDFIMHHSNFMVFFDGWICFRMYAYNVRIFIVPLDM